MSDYILNRHSFKSYRGGGHTYAFIVKPDGSAQTLTFELDEANFARLNKVDPDGGYHVGDQTERFESEQAAYIAAVAWMRENASPGDRLRSLLQHLSVGDEALWTVPEPEPEPEPGPTAADWVTRLAVEAPWLHNNSGGTIDIQKRIAASILAPGGTVSDMISHALSEGIKLHAFARQAGLDMRDKRVREDTIRELIGVVEDVLLEMKNWTGPYGYPGVARFIDQREARIRETLGKFR